MTAAAAEFVTSRGGQSSGQNTTRDDIYIVRNTSNPETALTTAATAAPSTVTRGGHTLVIRSYGIDVKWVDTVADIGEIEITVHYARADAIQERPQTGDRVLSLDLSAATEHKTQSFATVGAYGYAAGSSGDVASVTDYGNAIGVTDEDVQGCDVAAPHFAFTVTGYVADTDFDETYIGYLYALTGTTNDASYSIAGVGTFNQGELLYLGGPANERGTGADWEVGWGFEAGPNLTGLTVGTLTGIAKRAHEYMWVRYGQQENGTLHKLMLVPVAAYVEQVYQEGDFDDLEP